MKQKTAAKRAAAAKQETAGKEANAGKEKSRVALAARHIVRLLQNKVIGALMLMGQGVLFLVSPSGDVTPTIRLSAGLIILVCLAVVFFRMRRREKGRLDTALTVLSAVPMAAAAFFLFRPEILKPYVRILVGGVSVVSALVNLAETLKIKNKRDWKFFVSIIGVVAIVALGIVTIAAREEDIAMMQQSIGVILILNGVVNIWYIIQLRRELRASAQAPDRA